MDAVHVFLSTDINYATPTVVTVVSVLENSNKGRNYVFDILVDQDTKPVMKELMGQINAAYNNCTYNVCAVNEEIKSIVDINHLTVAMYYRIFMPKYCDYDRAVYIDSDIIVNCDIAELYDMDLDGKLIAGVRAAGYCFNKREVKYHCNKLNIPTMDQYINSGVLLFDLESIRTMGFDDRMIEALRNNVHLNDQDLFNMVYYDKIKTLGCEWNLMTEYYTYDGSNINIKDKASEIYGVRNIPLSVVKMLHYANRTKPWDDVPGTYPLKDQWEKYYSICKTIIPVESLPKFKKMPPLPKPSVSVRIRKSIEKVYDWFYNIVVR